MLILQHNIGFAWQPRYHDHIIRTRTETNDIAKYIKHNPVQWEADCFYNL